MTLSEAERTQAAFQASGAIARVRSHDVGEWAVLGFSYAIESRDRCGLPVVMRDRVEALNWLIRYWLPGKGE
jgi:hypothetical protein